MPNTVKLNGVRLDVIKLQLFPFSLKDVATTWFDSLLVGLVNSWEELVEAFMGRFFPPALTVEKRGEIIVFKKGEDESLYIAWERFKRLLKMCPMHGIDLTTQMDIFYLAMNYTFKGIIELMHLAVEVLKEEVQRRQGKLLKTLPNATTRLYLNLQGAVEG